MSLPNSDSKDRVPVSYRVEPISSEAVHYAIEQYFMKHGTPSPEIAETTSGVEGIVNLVMSSISSDRLALFKPQTFSPTQAALDYITTMQNAVSTMFGAMQTHIDKSCSGEDNVKCAEAVSRLPTFIRAMALLPSRVSSYMLARLSIASPFPMNTAADATFYSRWVKALPFTHESVPTPLQPQQQQQQQQAQQQ